MTSNIVELNDLIVRTIDKDIQEDARQLAFAGNSTSNFSIMSEESIDLSEQRQQGQSLFLNIKLENAITSPVLLSMECENDCKNTMDISEELKKLSLNEWQELSISLACFEKAGVNLSEVTSPFQITSTGPLTVSFSTVRISANKAQTYNHKIAVKINHSLILTALVN